MAFDAFFLTAVLDEVRARCIGARVDKLHQPSRDTLIFHLRCQQGREKLLFVANPTAPRLHLTAAGTLCLPVAPFCLKFLYMCGIFEHDRTQLIGCLCAVDPPAKTVCI